ncbi:MAG: ABC transporter substrate-binding protein, partial [Halobacteriaceae archaeon]
IAALAGCGGNAPDETTTTSTSTTSTQTTTPGDGTTQTTQTTDGDGDDETTTQTEPPQYTGGTLQLSSVGRIQTVDPIVGKGSGAGYNQYAESLMTFPNGQLPPQPSLANGYEVSDDGLTYTFNLKQGVMFHQAEEVDFPSREFTASDVVFSWRRLAGASKSRNRDDIIGETFTIAHEGNTDESVENYVPGSLAVRAPSKYTFEFTMEAPFHSTLSQIAGGAFAVIPENIVGDIQGYDGLMDYQTFAGGGLVGTGPFQIEEWSKGDSLVLSRFEDYHGQGPFIDGIRYTVMQTQSGAFTRFKNGNLDMVPGIPTAEYSDDRVTINNDEGEYRTGTYELDNGRVVNYGERVELDTDYVVFNCQRTDRYARRAIAWLFNQHRVTEDIWKGLGEPAYHITPKPVFPHDPNGDAADAYDGHAANGAKSRTAFGSDGYPYGYDQASISKARQIMEDNGHDQNNQYEITFTIFSGDPEYENFAQLIRDKGAASHFNITIEKADFGTIISRAIDGTMDMFALGDGMEFPEADNFLRFLHPYQDPTFMFTRWTYAVNAKDVQFGSDSPKTVAQNVADQLSNQLQQPVPAVHVAAVPSSQGASSGTVSVFIEPASIAQMEAALDG